MADKVSSLTTSDGITAQLYRFNFQPEKVAPLRPSKFGNSIEKVFPHLLIFLSL